MSASDTALMRSGATLLQRMGDKYGIEPGKFMNTIVTTVFTAGKAPRDGQPSPGRGLAPTNEMVMTFLIVAERYNLDPFLKEIYPFIDGSGNLKVVVGVDGWIKIALRHSEYDGHEFVEHLDPDKKLMAVTCKMFRKDRERPISMTEYMSECRRDTEPWKQWPYRMLHHKAFIQTARYALGMNDVIDDDEMERMQRVQGATHEILEEPRRIGEIAKPAKAGGNGGAAGVGVPDSSADPGRGRAPEPAAAAAPEPERTQERATEASPAVEPDAPLTSDQVKNMWNLAFDKGIGKWDLNSWLSRTFQVDRLANLPQKHLAAVRDFIKNR